MEKKNLEKKAFVGLVFKTLFFCCGGTDNFSFRNFIFCQWLIEGGFNDTNISKNGMKSIVRTGYTNNQSIDLIVFKKNDSNRILVKKELFGFYLMRHCSMKKDQLYIDDMY